MLDNFGNFSRKIYLEAKKNQRENNNVTPNQLEDFFMKTIPNISYKFGELLNVSRMGRKGVQLPSDQMRISFIEMEKLLLELLKFCKQSLINLKPLESKITRVTTIDEIRNRLNPHVLPEFGKYFYSYYDDKLIEEFLMFGWPTKNGVYAAIYGTSSITHETSAHTYSMVEPIRIPYAFTKLVERFGDPIRAVRLYNSYELVGIYLF